MAARTLIIGCGYIGLPLALRLQTKGHAITAWVHSAESAAALAAYSFQRIVTGSVADADVWTIVGKNYDFVIHCASSGRGGEEAYAEVFLQGAILMGRCQPQARKLFVSSTSVYGQTSGEIVTEESPAEPVSATSQILRQAENEALTGDTTVVRSVGIYGPTRSMLFEKFRRGDAVIEGEGSRWINQVHQRDLVGALDYLMEKGVAGEIYNVADNEPVMLRDYYAWCSEFLHRSLPPHGPTNPNRKRGLTNKRVSNAKLCATGWAPIYPSFRDGLTEDFQHGAS
jgi:nucleoside-diphosphate-sugar epimerase